MNRLMIVMCVIVSGVDASGASNPVDPPSTQTQIEVRLRDEGGAIIDSGIASATCRRIESPTVRIGSTFRNLPPLNVNQNASRQVETQPNSRRGLCSAYGNTNLTGYTIDATSCPLIDWGYTEGGTLCAFTFGYATDEASPGPVRLSFFSGGLQTPPDCPSTWLAAFDLSGLPGEGAYVVTIPIPEALRFAVPAGAVEYVYEFDNTDAGVLLASGGSGNENVMFDCLCELAWFGGEPWAGLYMSLQYLESCSQPESCTEATSISSAPFGICTTTLCASADGPTAHSCASGHRNGNIWFRFTPNRSGEYIVSTCGSSGCGSTYDTVLRVYHGSCSSLQEVQDGCNDDDGVDCQDSLQASLQVSLVMGETYYIEVAAYDEPGGLEFSIEFAPCQPDCGKGNIACHMGESAYAQRRAVARLLYVENQGGPVPICTGWMIGTPDCMITNQHCLEQISAEDLRAEFDYECNSCANGEFGQSTIVNVTGLIHENVELDYAILDLAGSPAEEFGTLAVSCALPAIGAGMYEIHHAGGRTKGYDGGVYTGIITDNTCVPGTSIEVGFTGIGSRGASGAPVFNDSTNEVEAICHCGSQCGPGVGVPMSAILSDLIASLPDNRCGLAGSVARGLICPECQSDSECMDKDFCNGPESCVEGQCNDGVKPCGSQLCDATGRRCVDCLSDGDCLQDGNFCNGKEQCEIKAGLCYSTGDPCPEQLCDANQRKCIPCPVGDANCDGQVSVTDYKGFDECLNGPSDTIMSGCFLFDFTGDNKLDLRDFGAFQNLVAR